MGNTDSGPAGRVLWRPSGSERDPCCFVVRIEHVAGLPSGAAELLAQWVRQGTQAYPHKAAVQRALQEAGAELQCAVTTEATTFSLVTAGCDWGCTFLAELLQRPLLESDAFEDLDMQRHETRPDLVSWIAQQWGWTATAPCKTAEQMRGVWQHLYTPARMTIAVAGNVPSSSAALLQQLRKPVSLAHHVQAWSPPQPAAPAPPITRHLRGKPAVTLLFAFPCPSPEQRRLIQYVWGRFLQQQCDACRSWATAAALQWHVLGDVAVLQVHLAMPPGVHLAGAQLAAEATQRLQQYTPPPAVLAAAHRTLQARERVSHGKLVQRTAALLESAPPSSGNVVELCRTYLAEPQSTVLHGKAS